MSKERLEEIKEKYSKANVIEHLNGIDIIAAAKRDIQWLIQQSELMQHFTRKNTELNVFLNKYSEPKHFGENVIDVAMDIIGKQAERVRKLERQVSRYKERLEVIANYINTENKLDRYREDEDE